MMMGRKFKRKQRKKMELEINSLLDILVILLVFLLKSFNPSDLFLEPLDNIEIPVSKSEDLGELAIVVQVSSKGNIYVDNKQILSGYS